MTEPFEIVYSPTIPLLFATNKLEPDIAIEAGLLNPEIRAALIVVPEVVYSLMVPSLFATNRLEPDTAIELGLFGPEINDGIEAPTVPFETMYSPIVPSLLATNKLEPDTAKAVVPSPEINDAFIVAPDVVYSPMTPNPFIAKILSPETAMIYASLGKLINDAFILDPDVVYSPISSVSRPPIKRLEPDMAMPVGPFAPSPEISEAFTSTPVAVYSATAPSAKFVTKICPSVDGRSRASRRAAMNPTNGFLSLVSTVFSFVHCT